MAGLQPAARESAVSEDVRKQCSEDIVAYFQTVSGRALELHKQLKKRLRSNMRMQLMKGEVPESLLDKTKSMQESLDKLLQSVGALSDLLDKDPPQLPDEPDEDPENELAAIITSESSDPGFTQQSLYDDEDTRSFYEDLPDLRLVVPPVLLESGYSKEKAKAIRMAKEDFSKKQDIEKAELEALEAAAKEAKEKETQEILAGLVADKFLDIDSDKYDGYFSGMTVDAGENVSFEDDDNDDMWKEKKSHPLELLLAGLPNAFNREAVDAIAEKFCYQNTKASRKRLVRVAYEIHRSQQDQLPYYARLVATLSAYFPEIGDELVTLLFKQFYGMLKRKDQTNIESKLKNIRYISELTKFKVAPSTVIFRCWHTCLLNFTPHSIQVCCSMLETCGRWLYRNRETHLRCTAFLERMMKLKKTKVLDQYLNNALDNAFYQCKPPVQSAVKQVKSRSPMHLYIRKMLYETLNPSTSEWVLRKLRKLPWDSGCQHTVLKCLANVANVKFSNIGELANIASGLAKYYKIDVPLVDAVLEAIRSGLETNYPQQKQRRLQYVKYLGELFVYFLVDAQMILDTLYLLITFGHSTNSKTGQLESALDPPDDYFRLQLVNCLLLTCSEYFDHAAARRLDRFLAYFERYTFLKETVPIDVEYMLADMYDQVNPRWKRARTVEEAMKKVEAIENDRSRKGAKDRLTTLTEFQKAAQSVAATDGLQIISEDEEENNGDEGDENSDEGDEGDEDDNQTQQSQASQNLDGLEDDDEGDASDEECEEDHEDELWSRRGANGADDDDFVAQFERMLQEDVEARKNEQTQTNLVPVSTFSSSNVMARKEGSVQIKRMIDDDGEEQDHVVFKVLTRSLKGGGKEKTLARDLFVPMECDMALNSVQQEQQMKDEKEDLKRCCVGQNIHVLVTFTFMATGMISASSMRVGWFYRALTNRQRRSSIRKPMVLCSCVRAFETRLI